MPQAEEVSQITDATERLSYVVRLTEGAANRTMDWSRKAPRCSTTASEAKALSTDWQRFMRREVAAPEFRELVKRVDSFLTHSAEGNRKVAGHLNDILLAQTIRT